MSLSIAVIPARGGSKRIPRKNLKSFCGQPIIKYSILAALEAGIFEEVTVSTDDPEIAEISKKLGAQVPFLRSRETSDDLASTEDVLVEVLERYRAGGRPFENFCCLYPTAPFLTAAKLRSAYEILSVTQAPMVLPVVRFSYPPQRALHIKKGSLSLIQPENLNARSQDLEPWYHDSGQFYFGNVQLFMKERSLFPAGTVPIVLPELEAQDIDNEQDWKIAEIKFQLMQSQDPSKGE